jgi:hypothetical protein
MSDDDTTSQVPTSPGTPADEPTVPVGSVTPEGDVAASDASPRRRVSVTAVVAVVALVAAVVLGVMALQARSDRDEAEDRLADAREELADAEERADAAEEELTSVGRLFSEQLALAIGADTPGWSADDTQCVADALIEGIGVAALLELGSQFSGPDPSIPGGPFGGGELVGALFDAFRECGVALPFE